jgi:hypothetical protein
LDQKVSIVKDLKGGEWKNWSKWMVWNFDYVKIIMVQNINGLMKYVMNEIKRNLKTKEVVSVKRWRNMIDLWILMRSGNIPDYYDIIIDRE